MNRRDFLKISAIGGITLAMPIKLFITEGGETIFLKHLAQDYPADWIVTLVKNHAWQQSQRSNINITQFFRGFVKRQPDFVRWLKPQLTINRVELPSGESLIVSKPQDQRQIDRCKRTIATVNKRGGLDKEYDHLRKIFRLDEVNYG